MIRCCRCGEPVDLLDAHDDPWTGEATHDSCCAYCDPTLADEWGLDLPWCADDERALADSRRPLDPLADVPLAGHGTPSRAGIERAVGEHR